MKQKKNIGFSVMDLILFVLILTCVLSSVFYPQIRNFLGREEMVTLEYTFLVENVTDQGLNHPQAGERIYHFDSELDLGEILSVEETVRRYQGQEDPEETVDILTLTCKARVRAEETEAGYLVGEVYWKPGAQFRAKTENASFEMAIILVKTV